MAAQQQFINETRAKISGLVQEVEQIQGKAAAIVQQWDDLGGAAFLSGYDWTGSDIDEAEFVAAIGSLTTVFNDVLDNPGVGNGTNLQKMRYPA